MALVSMTPDGIEMIERAEWLRVRRALTEAEDGLRAIASPDCGMEVEDDCHPTWDYEAAGRIARGTLERVRRELDEGEKALWETRASEGKRA